MISTSDAEFHPRDPADKSWTETTFLPFVVPDADIFGNLYVLARPNRGVAASSIAISKGFCTQPYQMDFTDPQMHLTCPESFTDYTLENGLSVKSTGPTNYHFSYENVLGACSFDLTFEAIHEPFDPHDPAQNPLLVAEKKGGADTRRGTEWENGHFEVKGHVTGQLELRGNHYDVDSYEGMDHSWGPRLEVGTRSVSWISLNFGSDLAMHIASPLHFDKGEVIYDPPRFGFVSDHGEVHGIVDAKITAERVDLMGISNHIIVTDVRGKTWEFYGTAIAGYPWYSFNPSHTCFQTMYRYTGEGLVGYGEMGDIFGLDYLAEFQSRLGRGGQNAIV